MKVLRTADNARAWCRAQRAAGNTIGFVPTMGALHEGHASLIKASVEQNDATVVSIFVNPTQFAPSEDFDQYPRTFDTDQALCEQLGAGAIYAPKASDMYPEGYATYVQVERVTGGLCGASRPHFFRGVATVVAKLFNAVPADRAYFGQKDAQQAAVIRRMVCDLDFGIEIVEMPIVREADGLAMSSRNAYLSPEERRRALELSKALFSAGKMVLEGERDAEAVKQAIETALQDVKTDYVAIVDAEEMTPLDRIEGNVLVAVAAWAGETRLIDNVKLQV